MSLVIALIGITYCIHQVILVEDLLVIYDAGFYEGAKSDILSTIDFAKDLKNAPIETLKSLWEGIKTIFSDIFILLVPVKNFFNEVINAQDIYAKVHVIGKAIGATFWDSIAGAIISLITAGTGLPAAIGKVMAKIGTLIKGTDTYKYGVKMFNAANDASKVVRYTIEGIEISVKYGSKGVVKVSHLIEQLNKLPYTTVSKVLNRLGASGISDNVISYIGKKWVFENYQNVDKTLNDIANGILTSHRNDGSVFRNDQLRLPAKSLNYYTEYVHVIDKNVTPFKPGDMRIVLGNMGEVYFTPDHYGTFIRIK